jgi:hypothetical protein
MPALRLRAGHAALVFRGHDAFLALRELPAIGFDRSYRRFHDDAKTCHRPCGGWRCSTFSSSGFALQHLRISRRGKPASPGTIVRSKLAVTASSIVPAGRHNISSPGAAF